MDFRPLTTQQAKDLLCTFGFTSFIGTVLYASCLSDELRLPITYTNRRAGELKFNEIMIVAQYDWQEKNFRFFAVKRKVS